MCFDVATSGQVSRSALPMVLVEGEAAPAAARPAPGPVRAAAALRPPPAWTRSAHPWCQGSEPRGVPWGVHCPQAPPSFSCSLVSVRWTQQPPGRLPHPPTVPPHTDPAGPPLSLVTGYSCTAAT